LVVASLTGWYVGLIIAAVVVTIVVVLVAIILNLARKIAIQAREVTYAIDDCRANTNALWDVSAVVNGVKNINKNAAAAREVLENQL
jgi:Na+-transporting NADH:ubiquinone oxidoreductase subunit NqrF